MEITLILPLPFLARKLSTAFPLSRPFFQASKWAVPLLVAAVVTSVFTLPMRAVDVPTIPRTFCNPIDLPYRFTLKMPSRREAADPTLVFYKGEYWLFASRSGGYWHTTDFSHWKLVTPTGLPLETYAPTVEIIGGKMYFLAGNSGILTTDDPAGGVWTKVAPLFGTTDPDLFLDDDGKLYLYDGCSNETPIYGEELDPAQDFKVIIPRQGLIHSNPRLHGWEIRRPYDETGTPDADADTTNRKIAPFIEGSWMTKVNGRYFLQYAAPGTELSNYGDGVYVGDHPLGPFTYMPANPFSYRPTGFVTSAGHGSTFRDRLGNYWHIATASVAVRAAFERRLVLYPMKFFADGQVAANTYLGDYPQYVPSGKPDDFAANSPGWMLLSLHKPVKASSELPNFPATNAVDENIKTWWSAATGHPHEWLQVDLGAPDKIEAVQINFADQGSTTLGRLTGDAYRYIVEASGDGSHWRTVIDRAHNHRDAPHDYEPLAAPVTARYVRIVNLHVPAPMLFSISGLRVFGNAPGPGPANVTGITAKRDPQDGRNAVISWQPSAGAEFYIVRYGIRPDRLYSNYQIYTGTHLDLHALNADTPAYYATVDAINASGIAAGPPAVPIQ
jgi:xylan 1,4-beta-xylosidase